MVKLRNNLAQALPASGGHDLVSSRDLDSVLAAVIYVFPRSTLRSVLGSIAFERLGQEPAAQPRGHAKTCRASGLAPESLDFVNRACCMPASGGHDLVSSGDLNAYFKATLPRVRKVKVVCLQASCLTAVSASLVNK